MKLLQPSHFLIICSPNNVMVLKRFHGSLPLCNTIFHNSSLLEYFLACHPQHRVNTIQILRCVTKDMCLQVGKVKHMLSYIMNI